MATTANPGKRDCYLQIKEDMAKKAGYSRRYDMHDRTTLGSTVKLNVPQTVFEVNRLLKRTATVRPGARYVHSFACNPAWGSDRKLRIDAIV